MGAQDQIAVLVADRQPLFRAGLARTIRLDPELRLVGDVEDATRALEHIRRLAPRVAIVDAEAGGVRVAGAVTQHGLPTGIVLMAGHMTRDVAFGAIAAGARGCLSKDVAGDTVCDAVRRVAAGGTVLCAQAQSLVSSEVHLRYGSEHGLLSPRQCDVLRLLADGLSFPEIGRRLHLAPTTVKTHAQGIYQRLGVRDRTGAVVEGMRRGILD